MRKPAIRTCALLLSLLTLTLSGAARAAPSDDAPPLGNLSIFKYLDSDISKPVEGAGFTAYQVLTLAWEGDTLTCTPTPAFAQYFQGGNQLPGTADELLSQAAQAQALQKYVLDNSVEGFLTSTRTNRYGQTALSKLPLGWYLIVETTTPSNARGSPGFLVPVPMKLGEDGWRYDIAAYPKSLAPPPIDPDPGGVPDRPVRPNNPEIGPDVPDTPDTPGDVPGNPEVDIDDPDTPLGPADPFLPTEDPEERDIPDERPPLSGLDLPKTGGAFPVENLLLGGPALMALSTAGLLLLERRRRSTQTTTQN